MQVSHCVWYPTQNDPISNSRVCFLEFLAGNISVSRKRILLLNIRRRKSDVDAEWIPYYPGLLGDSDWYPGKMATLHYAGAFRLLQKKIHNL